MTPPPSVVVGQAPDAMLGSAPVRPPSLGLSHRSVPVPNGGAFWRKLIAFAGPGYLVAVGYMDPGNWATDLAGGSAFGYLLLSVVLLSSLMAMLSRRATPETQGEVQGISSMALGIGSIVAPFVLNPAMAYFTSPQAPFRFAGAAFAVAAVFAMVAIVVLRRLPRAAAKA